MSMVLYTYGLPKVIPITINRVNSVSVLKNKTKTLKNVLLNLKKVVSMTKVLDLCKW